MHPHHPARDGAGTTPPSTILRSVETYRAMTGTYLASEEMRQRVSSEAAQVWLLKQAGVRPRPILPVATIRRSAGAALIRVGQRIKGTASAEQAARSAGTAS
jgi:hypothetical protein